MDSEVGSPRGSKCPSTDASDGTAGDSGDEGAVGRHRGERRDSGRSQAPAVAAPDVGRAGAARGSSRRPPDPWLTVTARRSWGGWMHDSEAVRSRRGSRRAIPTKWFVSIRFCGPRSAERSFLFVPRQSRAAAAGGRFQRSRVETNVQVSSFLWRLICRRMEAETPGRRAAWGIRRAAGAIRQAARGIRWAAPENLRTRGRRMAARY
jgi:hypothetical protein